MCRSALRAEPVVGEVDRSRSAPWATAILAAGLSGGLMAACYWPLNLHVLAWAAMIPWLLVLPRLGADRVWLYGTLLGLVFYRIGLAWLIEMSGPHGAVVILLLSLWMGLSFRVAKLLMDRFGTAAMLWAVPLAFVGQEVLRCEGLARYRFPFLAWGYSQSHNPWVVQIASIGGVHLVSFVVAAFSVAVAYGVIRPGRRWTPAVAVGVLVLVLAAVGQPGHIPTSREPAAACVQAEELDDRVYVRLTAQALGDPRRPAFVVLPEHAITDLVTERHPGIRSLAALAREHNAYICVGVHARPDGQAECYYDNVAMLIGPDGGVAGRQLKAVPLPLFEDGNPASAQATVRTPYGRVGLCVCYDALFTDIPRRLERLGAEILLVPVMDAERWPRQEREQHADMAPFRSIELRRCAVRGASSGVSQIIDAAGRVRISRSQAEGPGTICERVGFHSTRTLFARGGHWFATVVGVAFLAVVAALTVAQWIGGIRKHWRSPATGSVSHVAESSPLA